MANISLHITRLEPTDRRQVRRFLALPFRLYRDNPYWVPPLEPDIRLVFNEHRHPFYRKGAAAFFLAERAGGVVVGRLAVLHDRLYNDELNQRTGFFYLFECEDDAAAAGALFAAAADWCRSQGLDSMLGPKGFSLFDGFGLLVRGFDHRPAFGLPYNLPYYVTLLEDCGFRATDESLSGYLDHTLQFPVKINQVAALLQERRGLHVPLLRNRKELRAMIPRLKDLYNNSLGGTGSVPLTDEEVEQFARQMLWFADPHLIKIVMKGEQPVGFLFAYPDVSAAVQRIKGKVFPFGWLALWLELRRTQWININGAAMVEGYRGLGGTALLFSQMYQSFSATRYRYADLVQIGAENDRMLRELRDLGVDFYKAHRIYELEI